MKKIVDAVKANPHLWESTAIFITVDEGGGYYDSGYIQNLDFFGDGTSIPLIVVSNHTRGGHISHDYRDHVSILKFIERNWDLPTISNRRRDNFSTPKSPKTILTFLKTLLLLATCLTCSTAAIAMVMIEAPGVTMVRS